MASFGKSNSIIGRWCIAEAALTSVSASSTTAKSGACGSCTGSCRAISTGLPAESSLAPPYICNKELPDHVITL